MQAGERLVLILRELLYGGSTCGTGIQHISAVIPNDLGLCVDLGGFPYLSSHFVGGQ